MWVPVELDPYLVAETHGAVFYKMLSWSFMILGDRVFGGEHLGWSGVDQGAASNGGGRSSHVAPRLFDCGSYHGIGGEKLPRLAYTTCDLLVRRITFACYCPPISCSCSDAMHAAGNNMHIGNWPPPSPEPRNTDVAGVTLIYS